MKTFRPDLPPLHEAGPHGSALLPVNYFVRHSESGSEGCYYHWHEELELYYVKTGGVQLLCNGRRKWVYPGQLAVVNQNEPHRSLGFLDGTCHYVIQIDCQRLIQPFPLPLTSLSGLCVNQYEAGALIEDLLNLGNHKPCGWQLSLCAVALQLLSLLLETASHETNSIPQPCGNLQLVNQALDYVHRHLPEPISLASTARALCVSKSYLCHLFKQHTGLNLLTYINRLRVEKAAGLLREGRGVAEAARLSGYTNYSYFFRRFKQEKGLAPTDYAHKYSAI
ncbi:MAG: AraC family transcriptional regulator [Oscillospiraceae bacterium]|nr:AraC family transcriptional regulator [Oscillospiraceae bacterium]MDD4368737.1 AraC family transcriptional regulator [Oscillospiraceae bacterium]